MPKLFLRILLIGLFLSSAEAAQLKPLVTRSEIVRLPTIEVQLKTVAPKGERKRLPALLVFGGFEHAGEVLDLLHPTVPVVLASFNYPYSPPRKFHFPGSLRFAPEVKKSIHDTLRGIQELRKFLALHPEIDPKRISILGASFGSPFAAVAARDAERERDPFASVVLVHAFGDVAATARHQLMRSWEPRWGGWAKPLSWLVSQLGWWYVGAPDPEEALRELGSAQKVLVIHAAEDRFIPQAVQESLWKSLTSSAAHAQRDVMPGDHLQPGSEALIDKLLVEITDWLGRRGLLAPE